MIRDVTAVDASEKGLEKNQILFASTFRTHFRMPYAFRDYNGAA
jgi:hypothetical protein